MSEKTIPVVTPEEILALLKQGYTRYEKDNLGHGSIQAKYNLSDTNVKRMFSHPDLKNKKTVEPGFVWASVEVKKENDDIEKALTSQNTEYVNTEDKNELFS